MWVRIYWFSLYCTTWKSTTNVKFSKYLIFYYSFCCCFRHFLLLLCHSPTVLLIFYLGSIIEKILYKTPRVLYILFVFVSCFSFYSDHSAELCVAIQTAQNSSRSRFYISPVFGPRISVLIIRQFILQTCNYSTKSRSFDFVVN